MSRTYRHTVSFIGIFSYFVCKSDDSDNNDGNIKQMKDKGPIDLGVQLAVKRNEATLLHCKSRI
jgi:hypothetical protein